MRLPKLIFLFLASACACGAQTRYYATVDLGSKGVKSSLFSVVNKNGKVTWNIVDMKGNVINTRLVSSMKDGRFTPEGIHEAADAVRDLIQEMKNVAEQKKFKDVGYFVEGSSGVAKGENKDDLAAAVKTATGIEMEFITAREEAYLGFINAVPKSDRANAMYIDIGSGNTKLGCLVGQLDIKHFKSAEIPLGSVSGRNEGAKKNPTDIKVGIQQVMQEEVGPAYAKESMDIPCLRNRPVIYWTGGAAWAAATFLHPSQALVPNVTFSRHDLDAFLSHLNDGTWNQKKLTYPFPKDMPIDEQKNIRAKAEKDRRDVMDIFVGEDLISGISIMKTVLDSSNPSASIFFPRNEGGFLVGFAKEKYENERAEGGVSGHQ